MRPAARFGVLGSLEVTVAGISVVVEGVRRRALLSRLLISANHVVSSDRLINDLWGDALPAHPLNTLQACISYLRSILEPDRSVRHAASVLITRPPGYVLSVDVDGLDVLRFEQLVTQGRAALANADFEEASERLTEALAQWRGPVLGEFADAPWAETEVARLEELRTAAMEDRVEAELALGHHGSVISELETAVAVWPLRERLQAQLILALYRCGRQADALRAFGALRRMLAEELGIDPSPELRRLEEAILLQKPELDWLPPERRGSLVSEPAALPANNLPAPVSSFVGRHAELRALRALLPSTRILTLTGTGGVGKTRLALALAAEVLSDYPDGVWVVELAGTRDGSLVPNQIRAALELGEAMGNSLETILHHLRRRHLLLVLDNCEHLLHSIASVVEALLRACPNLQVLITSRERLRVEGETVWVVPSLSLPAQASPLEPVERSDAMSLFLTRVAAARGSDALSETDKQAAADICRRLGGIPLALELSAAWANVLSLEDMVARLGDRLAVLGKSSRSAPERHRTLRAAVDSTYDAVSELERCLFDRLSVFAGGFTADAAEQVCADAPVPQRRIFELLVALTEKSLVSVGRRDTTSRYALLEPLRHYGAEKLRQRGEEGQVANRHLDWAVSFAESAETGLKGPDVRRWLVLVDDEYDNLQTALWWAEYRRRHELGLRLMVGIFRYCEMRGRVGEGRATLERLLSAAPAVDPRLRARALAAASALAFIQNDPDAAKSLAQSAAAAAETTGSADEIAAAYLALGAAGSLRGDLARARQCHRQALISARTANDRTLLATALVNLGNVTMEQGDLVQARPLLEEAVVIRRAIGNPASVGRSLSYLGVHAHRDGRLNEARRLFEESVRALRDVGDDRGLLQASLRYAELQLTRNQFGAAAVLYAEATAIGARTGSFLWLASWLLRAGATVADEGDGATAGCLLGAARALLSALSDSRASADGELQELRQVVAHVRGEHPSPSFDAAFDEASNMPTDEAVKAATARLKQLPPLPSIAVRAPDPEAIPRLRAL